MTSRDFCYWLQGYFEITRDGIAPDQNGNRPAVGLTGEQIQTVRNHLAMVFKHEIDPSMGTKEHQEALGKLHAGHSPQTSQSTAKPAWKHIPSGDTLFRC